MRALILGAGMQGRAVAFDLIRSEGVEEVLLADADLRKAEEAAAWLGSRKVRAEQLDAAHCERLVEAMRGFDVVVSAVPYFYNLDVARAAVEAGVNLCDLGGNTDIVLRELELDEVARRAGITIVPDCGLAPGMTNVLAASGIGKLDRAEEVRIRVGGLPQTPRPPLDYKLVFSVYGLINEYVGQAAVLRQGEIAWVEALTGLEELEFPEPVGKCEAFHTAGGSSTLPWTYRGRVGELDYKTVRYPGHCAKVKAMRDLGLFDDRPVRVGDCEVRPRELFAVLANSRLDFPEDRDLVVLRVVVKGERDGERVEITYEMLDFYDEEHGITAMMRTTAYPVSIVAQMLARGEIEAQGVLPPERAIPPEPFVARLAERGIELAETVKSG
ncbi:MAG TPA: saccharopine dehydrogenase [Anaerolineae bacterium]|nr:saccharopine dehydrogenase [Anaerolineae bacterium]